jgi:hypothetical protein
MEGLGTKPEEEASATCGGIGLLNLRKRHQLHVVE